MCGRCWPSSRHANLPGLSTDAPAVLAALEAGETATFRDESDPYTLASVTLTADTLTLRLDEDASTLSLTPEDRHALADAIRATQLSPCELVV